MEIAAILSNLPYTYPFLFVDGLTEINENGVVGHYTFDPTLDFYKGHFAASPVTPGVILTETMAQIGVVCLGIYLLSLEPNDTPSEIWMTSAAVDYLKPVFPGERVTVTSEKKYFRFQKLKCEVRMHNENGELVCSGTIAGMFSKKNNGK
jgi:3-hydroxyacyl-[acyl-carrier-protein] dehydratase